MIESIKELLRKKKVYDAESEFLHNRFDDERCKPTLGQKERLHFVNSQLKCIKIWLSMLPEDELYVIQRHLIDGIDIPRIVEEYRLHWGEGYAKTERSIRTYQRRALNRIADFEQKKHKLIDSDETTKL